MMLIRTQEGNALVRCEYVKNDAGHIHGWTGSGERYLLGSYATEKRANDVIFQLIQSIELNYKVFDMPRR